MADLHVLMGLPLSGKTTYADHSTNIADDASVIELAEYAIDTDGPRMPAESWECAYADIEEALLGGASVVVDGNNTMSSSRRAILNKARPHAKQTHLHILCTPPSVCIKRCKLDAESRKGFMKVMRHQTDLFIVSLVDIPGEDWDCIKFISHKTPQEV